MTYTSDQLRDIADTLRRENRVAEFLSLLLEGATPATSYREGPFGNVYLRPMDFGGAGSVIVGHKHNYDHVTFLTRGAVVCRFLLPGATERQERIYRAPACVLVKKDVEHEFTALEPNTWAVCVYALRDSATGEVAQAWDGSLHPYR
jgi:hypothetical protein